jgi:ABC transporter substrate binding protein
MTRRTIALLITLTLGLLMVPLATRAQPPTPVRRIGVLSSMTRERDRNAKAFLEGMRALGYVEGQHLLLEYRGAAGQYERLPALAAELVQLKPEVIVAQGTLAALAAKDAATTIPLVMVGVADPVWTGLVASLARPGGNVTGLTSLTSDVQTWPRHSLPLWGIPPTRKGLPSVVPLCVAKHVTTSFTSVENEADLIRWTRLRRARDVGRGSCHRSGLRSPGIFM